MRITVLARKNLNMTGGKLAAQSVHAAIQLQRRQPHDYWACVVLRVSDKKFAEGMVAHPGGVAINDSGTTEVAPGTTTVYAFYEHDPKEEESRKRDSHQCAAPQNGEEVANEKAVCCHGSCGNSPGLDATDERSVPAAGHAE